MKNSHKVKILASLVLALGASGFAQQNQPSQNPATQMTPMNAATINPFQVEAGLSADQYHQRALDLANQADAMYNPDFYDQVLWTAAANYAKAAVKAAPDNTTYLRTLGMIYTKTQFWYRAYEVWTDLASREQLDAEARQWAALSAAKVGYIRMSRGLPQEAVPFFEASLRWQANPTVQAMLEQAQNTVAAPDNGQ